MSRRIAASAGAGAFLGGLLGSSPAARHRVAKWGKQLLALAVLGPTVLLMRAGVPADWALRLTVLAWVLLFAVLLWRKVSPAVRRGAAWTRDQVHAHPLHAPRMLTGGRRCAVYRLFDQRGQLLYVGISFDVDRRLAQHAADPRKRFWWYRVQPDATVVTWYPSRAQAKAVESSVIDGADGERPLFNIAEASVPA